MRRFRVVIAGGGVAALEAALALRRLAEERVSVDLVAPEPRFWYRPLAVVESFGRGRLHGLDLAELADEAGALFVVDELASVDADLSHRRDDERGRARLRRAPRGDGREAGRRGPGGDHVPRTGRRRGILGRC
jgi:2-polyprenyl-6-methoxyphenol hydroxylase-like FAD-dependent oxidoreductase